MLLPRLAGRFPTAASGGSLGLGGAAGAEAGSIYPLGVIVFACTIGAISALFALLAYRYFRTGTHPGPRGDGVVSTTTAGIPQGVVRVGRLIRSRVSARAGARKGGKAKQCTAAARAGSPGAQGPFRGGKVHPFMPRPAGYDVIGGQGQNQDQDELFEEDEMSSLQDEEYDFDDADMETEDDVMTMTMDEVTEFPKNHLVTCLEGDSAMLTDEEDMEDREIFL